MNYAYLSDYAPPAPALQISLGYPAGVLSVGPVTAIVDTGADGTLIPRVLIEDVGAPFVDDVRIRSHWGEWRNAPVFAVDIGVGEMRLPGVEVVGDEWGQEIVLGRNVLNRLVLLLDGPHGLVRLLNSGLALPRGADSCQTDPHWF
ncbi:MAG: hypothetical protein CVU38_02805 [Chloroflexi bacterium HGW-Chloroflexi-1]|nr:MAG: hypothetical protein CVU38_02805 [Chloroflexi bacterium HGW-Chloroflexi-1]